MISCSYTSSEGIKRDFSMDGIPSPGSEIDRMIGSNNNAMSAAASALSAIRRPKFPKASAFKKEEPDGKVKIDEFDNPTYLKDKLKDNGCIVVDRSSGKVMLKGENRIDSSKNLIFSSVGGNVGFFDANKIDPPSRGKLVGPKPGDKSIDPNSDCREEPDGNAWTIPIAGRIFLENQKEDGSDASNLIIIYQFIKDLYVSQSGRIIGIGPERREIVGSFIPGEEGGGEVFGAYPEIANGLLQGFWFGSQKAIKEKFFGNMKIDEIKKKADGMFFSIGVRGCAGQADFV